ncbi:MAG: AAC(3) family N-acetyltransferase [Erysipelotrichaceae bacterium]|nr:AAC(3) family N-acetyltransferase [Erysipelotrichaceae bacterium]
MLYKNEISNILNKLNIKSSDTLLIHSSLKSIGKIEGKAEGLLEVLMSHLSNGLLIFPTHTWGYINKDEMIFDVNETPSCVGELTNIARKTKGFYRSMHPTHSVCAYGKKAKWYVDHDLTATTPVGIKNCFGILKDLDAKIMFIGAPLSKNTFIHAIEEEFNVPDRFTDHIYHFYSKNNEKTIEYNMPRHFSKYNAHLSEHYEKLLSILLEKNIAKEFYLGNAKSYLIDAKKCHKLVSEILTKDIHAFDSFKDISHLV